MCGGFLSSVHLRGRIGRQHATHNTLKNGRLANSTTPHFRQDDELSAEEGEVQDARL